MFKFRKLNNGQKYPSTADMQDFISVVQLCEKFKSQLFDDFRFSEKMGKQGLAEAVSEVIEEAGEYFWIIKTKADNKFVGFVYLYDLVGSANKTYSGVIGTCICKEFWGRATEILGRKFLRYCFNKLDIKKLKCETFRSNPFITGLLRKLGFRLEGVAVAETIVRGEAENLLKWAIGANEWLAATKGSSYKKCCKADKARCASDKICASQAKKKGVKPLDYTSRSINNEKIIPLFAKKEKDY